MYSSQETAAAAVEALKDRGFSEASIHVVAPPEPMATTAEDGGPSAASVLPSIIAAGVTPSQAPIFAEGVHRGETLVVVHPLFGYAQAATTTLDEFEPIAAPLPEAEPAVAAAAVAYDNAAPLSSALGIPVLSSDPTPLSTWLNWRTLKPDPESSTVLENIRKQSGDAAPLSDKVGMPTLSQNIAPFSGMFGWALLSDNPAPLSTKWGWRQTSDEPAPLSKRFGWRTLLDNPAPLSSWLGWKTLSTD
jgi:hypothetical protein